MLTLPKFFKANTLYAKIALSFVLTIVITILTLSTILYINFENIGLKIYYNLNKENLKQVGYSATLMRNTAQTLAFQIRFDTRISDLLTYKPVSLDESQAINQLSSYRNTSPFIDSIYIYNGLTKNFYVSSSNVKVKYSKNEFFDHDIVNILDRAQNQKIPDLIPRSSRVSLTGIDKDRILNAYSFILYDLTNERDLDNAIVLNISEDWMRETIDSLDSIPSSDTFIINNAGETVIRSLNHGMMDNLTEYGYIQKILSAKEQSGYFVGDVYGVKSLVTYLNSDLFDWKFVRVTPYANVVGKIDSMKTKTVAVCLIILLAGFLFSFLISNRLYKPINLLTKKLTILEKEEKKRFLTARQDFLRSLLHNETDDDREDQLHKLEHFHVELLTESSFMLIIFRIDHFSAYCAKYNYEDRNAQKYAMMNRISPLFAAHCKGEAIDSADDQITVVFNVPDPSPDELHKLVQERVQEVQEAVFNPYDISVSAAVSSIGDTISSISVLYDEAVNASLYRIFYGSRCTVFAEDTNKLKLIEYAYPVQKEKYLTDMLKLGKLDHAKTTYLDIVNGTNGYSFPVFRSAISHIEYAVSSVIESIERGAGSPSSFYMDTGNINLSAMESVEEVNHYFYKRFDDIGKKLEERKSLKSDELVDKITKIINDKYMEQSLSITRIAELSKISTTHLGRMFKKLTSKSIIDYINEIRIEKAKQLLISSHSSVNDISEQTGFTNSSYFYTVFKKYTGITPNEFRQANKQVE
ncbi:helix-turn-helix domain-containing protein [Cohnella soli]|uniref:Helix-turn-helix domain-containing protein n=1 Tax=Cohnella soli TaxID=425005 RepID=A0ABW0HWG7_9BACL